MFGNKIKIRLANISDCKSLFDWRKDEQSRVMSFNGASLSKEEHNTWFEKSLSRIDRQLYIGELGNEKIGVCRFDFNQSEMCAEVSINMNPTSRGQGLGKRLLFDSVEYHLIKNKHNLVAKIKPNNLASLNIFESAGFENFSVSKDIITLKRDFKEIYFKEVCGEDAEVLFQLLKKRKHKISHDRLPTKEEHILFVNSNPYRYWAIVLEDKVPVGTYYIQANNSIGLNLIKPNKALVYKILCQIQANFKPLNEVKSKVPPYFFINVSFSNEQLGRILSELDAVPIQTSYKIENEGK